MFRFLLCASATLVVAKVTQRRRSDGGIILDTIQVDESGTSDRISPTLKPKSSVKFFNEDYPGDKRPEVDVLHFKHPYPVVQDSDEFDKDFVKDENNDNGQWKAQGEYDRLRHKLTKLKKEVAEALNKKNKEKAELDEAMKDYQRDMAENKAAIASKSKQVDEFGDRMKAIDDSGIVSEDSKKAWGRQIPQMPKIPPPARPDPFHFNDPVPKAMKDLEECKRQLEQANAELKKLMDELEKAKVQQAEAQEKLNQAMAREAEAEKQEDKFHKKYAEETSEHAAAEAAYAKQKALVDKLKVELDKAAAKVKAMRDAEDKSGGVYPTPIKSAAKPIGFSLFVAIACVVAVGPIIA